MNVNILDFGEEARESFPVSRSLMMINEENNFGLVVS